MLEKIRILHVLAYVVPYAGTERKVVQLLNNLDADKFQIYLASLTDFWGNSEDYLCPNVKKFSLKKADGIRLGIIIQLAKIMKNNKIDIVHSHNWATLFYVVSAATLARVPVIIHGEHGRETKYLDKSFHRFHLKKVLYHLSDVILAVSQDLANSLINIYSQPRSKIHIIRNGVEISKFKNRQDSRSIRIKYKIPDNKLAIGTCARIKPVKDLITLIIAFESLFIKHKNLFLVIAGPGNENNNSYYRELLTYIKKSPAKNAIKFLGSVKDIQEIYSILDIYVNSSLTEGMSNTILEAMTVGLPVIASDTGGNPELIEDDYNGFLFPIQNHSVLAVQLQKLISDKKLRERLGENGVKLTQSKFDIKKMYENYSELYQSFYLHKSKKESTFKTKARKILSKSIFYSGIYVIIKRIYYNKFLVLTFHRILSDLSMNSNANIPMITSKINFELMLDILSSKTNILSIDDILTYKVSGAKLPENTICITFDDGYLDNFENALPLLKKYEIPATFFVTTQNIDTGKYFWWDEVDFFFKNHPDIDVFKDKKINISILQYLKNIINSKGDNRINYLNYFVRLLNILPHEDKKSFLDVVFLKNKEFGNKPPLIMNWNQLKYISANPLFNIGSHTDSHLDMYKSTPSSIFEDINRSIYKLEKILGTKCEYIAYPNGSTPKNTVELFRQFKFKAGFTTVPCVNHINSDFTQYNRIDAGYLFPARKFDKYFIYTQLTGLFDRYYFRKNHSL